MRLQRLFPAGSPRRCRAAPCRVWFQTANIAIFRAANIFPVIYFKRGNLDSGYQVKWHTMIYVVTLDTCRNVVPEIALVAIRMTQLLSFIIINLHTHNSLIACMDRQAKLRGWDKRFSFYLCQPQQQVFCWSIVIVWTGAASSSREVIFGLRAAGKFAVATRRHDRCQPRPEYGMSPFFKYVRRIAQWYISSAAMRRTNFHSKSL